MVEHGAKMPTSNVLEPIASRDFEEQEDVKAQLRTA
jgi:hypothetical protein